MAGVVYALVQYGYNQTAGWVKLLCHYPATHLGHLACSLFPLFTLLLSHFKKLKLQLPGGNCKKAIGKMELPGGNCRKAIVKMELPGGNCKNTFSFYSCRHLKPLCTYATTPTLLAIGCEVRIINSRTFFLLNSNLLLFY